MEVKSGSIGVRLHRTEGVPKVHQEEGPLLAELVLDDGAGEVRAMEKISCSDMDGVGVPRGNVRVVGGQVVGRLGGKVNEGSSVGGSSVLESVEQ